MNIIYFQSLTLAIQNYVQYTVQYCPVSILLKQTIQKFFWIIKNNIKSVSIN